MVMELKSGSTLVVSSVLVGLVYQSLIATVNGRNLAVFTEQKSYYTPGTPSSGTSPTSHTPTGSGGSYGTPTPAHGSSGGYYHSPPTPSSGSSPYTPTPVYTSPVTPTPTTPSTPTPVYTSPVTPTPTTPSIPTPVYTSPVTPTPTTPSTPTPINPYDPHNFIGTCDYWKSHPMVIWAVFGYWPGTINNIFGSVCGVAFGSDPTLHDALANTRNDGIGSLFREGTAAFLNSIVSHRYPFTTQQVKDAFVAAAVKSDAAAAAQAAAFKKANEGRHV